MTDIVVIAYDPSDHRVADTIRNDLARRGWRTEPVALGTRAQLVDGTSPVLALIPQHRRRRRGALAAARRMAERASRIVIVISPDLPVPSWMYEEAVDAVIPFGDGRQ